MRFLLCAAATLATLASAPLPAQGLLGQVSSLFIFGPGQDPLFLAGSADPNNPISIREHGDHFVPAASTANGTLISFITEAVGANVANVPLSASSSGETFRFVGGVPERTSTSAGPVFGERAQTLGRGRVLAGINRSSFHFQTLRGVDLRDIQLTFTHENVNFPGCDSAFHGDCSKMGIPPVENDVMQFNLSLDIHVDVTSLYLTYGVLDRLDLGVVVPIVSTSLTGSSEAQIVPFGGPPVSHFFGGTPENPVLTASRNASGSALGLGDVALRLKYNLRQTPRTSVALFGDARFPTGSRNDLLGSGFFAVRGIAVMSARFGDFSPHVNTGYLHRRTSEQNDALLGTLGFDQSLARHFTLAVDLVSELQVGDSKLKLPQPVHYDAPFQRTVIPTTIPDIRDDIVNGSFGFKFTTDGGFTVIANALFPLNRGGLRPGVSYTAGLEYAF
jgi:hypothetical protein